VDLSIRLLAPNCRTAPGLPLVEEPAVARGGRRIDGDLGSGRIAALETEAPNMLWLFCNIPGNRTCRIFGPFYALDVVLSCGKLGHFMVKWANFPICSIIP
jgi:hypothetical protein